MLSLTLYVYTYDMIKIKHMIQINMKYHFDKTKSNTTVRENG